MALANKRETVKRAVQVLADMTGQDLDLKYQQFEGYQIQNKQGTYQTFGDRWMELGDLFLRVQFAITALRMQQVNREVTVVTMMAPNAGPIMSVHVFRGKLDKDLAVRRAVEDAVRVGDEDKSPAATYQRVMQYDHYVEYTEIDRRIL